MLAGRASDGSRLAPVMARRWSPGVSLALVILATIVLLGSLVAGYFMHLVSEKKLIYAVLALTAFFFVALMALPSFTTFDGFGTHTADPIGNHEAKPTGAHE